MSALDKAVTQNDDGWDFQCPGVRDSGCGDPATGQPFVSTGWPTKKAAAARGLEHFAEHKGEGVMSSLEDFRTKHGLIVGIDGRAATLEEI